MGGLFGIGGGLVPTVWSAPWAGRIGVGLAGHDELRVDELVERTVAVAHAIA